MGFAISPSSLFCPFSLSLQVWGVHLVMERAGELASSRKSLEVGAVVHTLAVLVQSGPGDPGNKLELVWDLVNKLEVVEDLVNKLELAHTLVVQGQIDPSVLAEIVAMAGIDRVGEAIVWGIEEGIEEEPIALPLVVAEAGQTVQELVPIQVEFVVVADDGRWEVASPVMLWVQVEVEVLREGSQGVLIPRRNCIARR